LSARAARTGRIALLTTSYPRARGDAAGHFVESEARVLTSAGHEVHVVAPGALRVDETRDGTRIHWLADRGAFGFPGAIARLKENPLRALGATEFALRAARLLDTEGPFTRIQAHFLVPCAWPIALAAEASAALELVGHGSDVRLFCRLPEQLRKYIVNRWLARGASVRVTSTELASLLSTKNPALAPYVSIQASPIEIPPTPSRSLARRELGLADGLKIAVIVARLVPGKRVAEALSELAPLGELSLIVVGDGPELAPLRARFPRVHFTGQVPRSRALAFIAAADVLVSASEHEGAPTVIREARALGVPVVAVPAGDLASWAARDPSISLTQSPFGVNARQKVYEVAGLGA